MIQAIELRLENLVIDDVDGKIKPVKSLSSERIILASQYMMRHTTADHITGIPLMVESLIKCGFQNEYEDKWQLNGVEICGNDVDGYLLLNGEERTNWVKRYFQVHQLQNIYHDLTGEEIKYKL